LFPLFVIGVNDTSGKFAAGVVDTGGKGNWEGEQGELVAKKWGKVIHEKNLKQKIS
jgi:hypothetical protein